MPRGKWSPYEHGSRALCLAHWPEKIHPRSTQALAMYCDILPTMMDYAGGTVEGLDGRSLKALWSDPETTTHREAALISNVHPFWQKAIVTPQYKLVWTGHPTREHIWSNFTSKGKFFSKPWAEWKARAAENPAASAKVARGGQPGQLELYDILTDPYETKNLAGLKEQQERVNALHTQLKQWMTECGEETKPPAPKKQKRARKKD